MFSIMIIALFLLLIISAAISIIYWTIVNGISPMPTSPKVKVNLLTAIPKNINGVVYELGSGWGTLAFPLAKRFPLNPIKAYENSVIPYFFCRLRLTLSPQPNLSFFCSDFFKIDLNDAGLIVCYLFPGAMKTLKNKFDQELKPGTFIITNTFSIPGLTPIYTVVSNDLYRSTIYVYQK